MSRFFSDGPPDTAAKVTSFLSAKDLANFYQTSTDNKELCEGVQVTHRLHGQKPNKIAIRQSVPVLFHTQETAGTRFVNALAAATAARGTFSIGLRVEDGRGGIVMHANCAMLAQPPGGGACCLHSAAGLLSIWFRKSAANKWSKSHSQASMGLHS